MLRNHRLLNSENHTGEDVDLMPSLVRADFEDAIVQALEDTLRDGKLDAFRSLLRSRWGREFPRAVVDYALTNDGWCYYMVYFYTCTLRRMMSRWEHCANKLMLDYGTSPDEIPQGTDWITI